MSHVTPIRVMIVDDHPIVRKGFIQLVNEDPSIVVVAEAQSAKSAWEQIEQTKVDVVVTDFDMPEQTGLELARQLRALPEPIPVVMLTMHENVNLLHEAVRVGVGAYLLKDEVVDNIALSIHSVWEGSPYVSPALSKLIIQQSSQDMKAQDLQKNLRRLTRTERRILKLITEDLSSLEIASDLGVSYRTVTTHRHNICRKLKLIGNHPLLSFALENRSEILKMDD